VLFNSTTFLFLFLPCVLALCLPLRGRALLFALTISSFFFYTCAGHAWFLVPMLVTLGLDFYLGQRMAASSSPSWRRAVLCLSLSCNLALLFYFKYSGLMLRTAQGLGFPVSSTWTELFAVTLPAGISFYTFQTMSYMIDLYRGEAEVQTDFWKFAGFVSFFPHLVAGPLTRHNQLIPQLSRISDEGIVPRWRAGIYLFAIGLAKKVLIADRIAAHIDPILNHAVGMGLFPAWGALLGYTLQIYFDFSGYSDMAIGLGRLFGIELPVNFNSPYRSLSPREFWKRWHITLSEWIRDYVYIPLNSRRDSRLHALGTLIVTMFLGGLWHGAGWTFAAWGVYHGILLAAHRLCSKAWDRLPALLRMTATFMLVSLGWVLFRAPSFGEALFWFKNLAGAGGPGLGLEPSFILLLGLGFFVVFFVPNAVSYERYEELPVTAQAALGLAAAAAILTMGGTSRFIYFQF